MMNKAVFLDRDGVVNKELGRYLHNVDEFELNAGICESVKLLKDNGFVVIVISNQGAIAKGVMTHEAIQAMHARFCKALAAVGTNVDDFYYCPHHDTMCKCICRKPDSGLLEKAIATYNIDPRKSFMIGDSDRDVEAAEKVGVKGIKTERNQNILDICKTLIHR